MKTNKGQRRIRTQITMTLLLFSILLFATSCLSLTKWTKDYVEKVSQLPPLEGKVEANIVFKKTPTGSLKLDIYHPIEIKEKNPVYVFIYGGSWIAGSRKMVRGNEIILPDPLNKLKTIRRVPALQKVGVTIVAISYRYLTETPMGNIVGDVHDAFSFLTENAEKYHLDMENIVIHGQSAGAHLALEYAFTTANQPQYSMHIKGLIDEYGPTNIQTLSDYRPVFARKPGLTNQTLKLIPIDARYLYSPIYKANSNSPDLLILHGDKDDTVPVFQSIDMMNRIERCTYIPFVAIGDDYTAEELANPFLYQIVHNSGHGFNPKVIGVEKFNSIEKLIVDYVIFKLGLGFE